MGYTTQNQPAQVTNGNITTVDVRLVESLASLNEVVVIGSRSTQVRSSTQTVVLVDVIQARDLVATGQIEWVVGLHDYLKQATPKTDPLWQFDQGKLQTCLTPNSF